MHSIHRTMFDPGRLWPLGAAFLLLVASAVLAPTALAKAPEVNFDAPEVDGGSVIIDYSINRKPQQVLDQTCDLDPLGFTPCPEGSEQEPKGTDYTFTQEGLAAGEYTYEVFFTLTDGEIISASVAFTVEGCLATNVTQATPGSANLQAEINGANSGDTIEVRGVCVGNFIINKSLTLQGRGTSPTLFGSGSEAAGPVLFASVLTSDVVINDLLITNGKSSGSIGVVICNFSLACAAGIMSFARLLTLNYSIVSGNGTSATPQWVAGGIAAFAMILNHSTVSGNESQGPGGISVPTGTTVLNYSTVSGNTSGRSGGGICNCGFPSRPPDCPLEDHSTLILNHSKVSENTAGDEGAGGILNLGFATLNHSEVSGNIALGAGNGGRDGWGGGIWNLVDSCNRPTLTLNDSTVNDNHAILGGGILNGGTNTTTTLKGSSSVTDNTAADEGGGIFSQVGVLNACDNMGVAEWTGAISPNDPDDPPIVSLITCN